MVSNSSGPFHPCRLARQVKKFGGQRGVICSIRPLLACPAGEGVRWLDTGLLASALLHLPDKPAGVEGGPVKPSATPRCSVCVKFVSHSLSHKLGKAC